jgi:hypothetical protein
VVPLAGRRLDAAGILDEPRFQEILRDALHALRTAVAARRSA